MPTYEFYCEPCNKSYEIKMKMSEHSELKDKMECQECHGLMVQSVSRLRFRLAGQGWFANEYGGGSGPGSGYEITQTELDKNLEDEKRIEERYNTAVSKGEA